MNAVLLLSAALPWAAAADVPSNAARPVRVVSPVAFDSATNSRGSLRHCLQPHWHCALGCPQW
jgi:hypothetical protein